MVYRGKEVFFMTNMKRVTITFDESIDNGIFNLRKEEGYIRCSYSEIVRRLVRIGLQAEARRLGKDYAS